MFSPVKELFRRCMCYLSGPLLYAPGDLQVAAPKTRPLLADAISFHERERSGRYRNGVRIRMLQFEINDALRRKQSW